MRQLPTQATHTQSQARSDQGLPCNLRATRRCRRPDVQPLHSRDYGRELGRTLHHAALDGDSKLLTRLLAQQAKPGSTLGVVNPFAQSSARNACWNPSETALIVGSMQDNHIEPGEEE